MANREVMFNSHRLCGGTSIWETQLGAAWDNKCPVPATSVRMATSVFLVSLTQLLIGIAPTTVNVELVVTDGGSIVGVLVADAQLQRPTVTSCSSVEKVKITDVTVENAVMGGTMTTAYTFEFTEALRRDPTLHVKIRTRSGSLLPCVFGIGSCVVLRIAKPLNLLQLSSDSAAEPTCGRLSWVQLRDNKCPVPATAVRMSTWVYLVSLTQMLIGVENIITRLNFTDNDKPVGCTLLVFDLDTNSVD
ncbi:hypothetical protein MTO96_039759 [Rhipicephalus appendiculatus]